MQNTVRTLVALHHTQSSLAADAPVEYLKADNKHVLAYHRGQVVVVLNLATEEVNTKVSDIEEGTYTQWLDCKTIENGPSATEISLDANTPISLEAKGFAVYVKQ